jgi:squalene-hopene/tetraprenyl-beta-curcumene cyclase
MCTKLGCAAALALALGALSIPRPAESGDPATAPSAKELQAVVDKAINYLKSSQGADGSFSPKIAGPGITALVVAGLVRNGVGSQDPMAAKALAYLESQVQKDGGVYNKFLANDTTSVAVMAFKEANKGGKYDSIIKSAGDFIKRIQHATDPQDTAFGGFSYDGKKRPDMSNSAFSIEALIAAGIPKDDPAIQKALTFLGRCQNLPGEFNDQPFARKTTKDDQGGFVYSPFDKDEKIHKTPEGGLRSLGAMTYGGLKSFLYAGVSKEDPRVKAAVDWVRRHYTLEENIGMGKAGLYYYYHTFGKAMTAWGENPFADASGKKHHWQQELFEAIRSRQNADGSWRNQGERTFAEDNQDLCSAFALLSLSYCKGK